MVQHTYFAKALQAFIGNDAHKCEISPACSQHVAFDIGNFQAAPPL